MLLGIAALAIPAAVPASQPAVGPLPGAKIVATLLADPQAPAAFAIALPTHYTTLEWIDQDPFVR